MDINPEPTEHNILSAARADRLPRGSIVATPDVMGELWPLVKIAVTAEQGGGWVAAVGAEARALDPAARYHVLHVPLTPAHVGDPVARAQAQVLPHGAIMVNRSNLAVQVHDVPGGSRAWRYADPLGASYDEDELYANDASTWTLVWLPPTTQPTPGSRS